MFTRNKEKDRDKEMDIKKRCMQSQDNIEEMLNNVESLKLSEEDDVNDDEEVKMLKHIFSILNIENTIEGDKTIFTIVKSYETGGLLKTSNKYEMNVEKAVDFLVDEFDLKLCQDCDKYQINVNRCDCCSKFTGEDCCAEINPSLNNNLNHEGDIKKRLEKYKTLCSSCYHSMITYKNNEILELIKQEKGTEVRNNISLWLKECDLYITDSLNPIYSLYQDNGDKEILVFETESLDELIYAISEFYFRNTLNSILNKCSLNNVKSEDVSLSISNLRKGFVGENMKYKKEDIEFCLKTLTTEEILEELKHRIVKG